VLLLVVGLCVSLAMAAGPEGTPVVINRHFL